MDGASTSDAPHSVRVAIDERRVISETIEGETIIIDSVTGAYFTVDGLGSTVWAHLDSTGTVLDDLVASVAATVGVDADAARPSVHRFVAELAGYELVRISGGPGEVEFGTAAEPAADMAPALPAVILTRYSDLEELILIDPIHEVDPERGWPHPPGG